MPLVISPTQTQFPWMKWSKPTGMWIRATKREMGSSPFPPRPKRPDDHIFFLSSVEVENSEKNQYEYLLKPSSSLLSFSYQITQLSILTFG